MTTYELIDDRGSSDLVSESPLSIFEQLSDIRANDLNDGYDHGTVEVYDHDRWEDTYEDYSETDENYFSELAGMFKRSGMPRHLADEGYVFFVNLNDRQDFYYFDHEPNRFELNEMLGYAFPDRSYKIEVTEREAY